MPKSLSNIHQQFIDFELSNGLFDCGSGEKHTWELVRLGVYSKILVAKGLLEKEVGIDRSLKNLFSIFMRNVAHIFFQSPFFLHKRKVIVFSSGRRLKNSDGLYWDIYADNMINEMGEENFGLIENMNFAGTHPKPVRTKHIAYSDSLHLLSQMMTKIFAVTASKKEQNLWRKLEIAINSEFGTKIPFYGYFKTRISTYNAERIIYRFLFWRLKPRSVGVINGPNRKAILQICREIGIKSFEIQHGTIGRYHMGYYFPKDKQRIYPDYFLFMGTYWKKDINNPVGGSHSFLLGHPFLESKFDIFKSVKKKNQALFVSQALEIVFKYAAELKSKYQGNIEVVVKLHPSEYKDLEKLKAKYSHSDIAIAGHDSNVYALLAESKWVFGIYSTVMFEALKFNCRCYAINHPGVEYLENLIKEGMVILVNETEMVDLNISSNSDLPENYSEQFFKSNWKENIKEFKNYLF